MAKSTKCFVFSDKTPVRLGPLGIAGSGYSDIFIYTWVGLFVGVEGGGLKILNSNIFGFFFRKMKIFRGMKIF